MEKLPLVLSIIVLFWIIFTYNRAISLRNYVKEAFSTMDVYLKKRFDLLPNLIEIVKAYSSYEKEVFTKITSLRAKNYTGMSYEEKLDFNKDLRHALIKAVAIAENYPEIKANNAYEKLMKQLEEIEEDIANSRKYYNGTVRELNTFIEIFPQSIVCSMFKVQKARLFEASENERNMPEKMF